MFYKLLIIFAAVPLIELMILIRVGQSIGIIPTIILVAGTGVLGITIAKMQGLLVLDSIKRSLQQGDIPAQNIMEGLLVLMGAAMLLTPGLITDVTGFLFILPLTRPALAGLGQKIFGRYITTGEFSGSGFSFYYKSTGNSQENDASRPGSQARTIETEYTVGDEEQEKSQTGKEKEDSGKGESEQ